MKKYTVSEIMKHRPCEDWTKEMIAKRIGKGKTLLEISRLRGVPIKDKIWCITRFLPDDINRRFAVWCARQCETDVPEIGACIDAIEAYYFGDGTENDMRAADWAAYSAADRAAYWAADEKMRQKQLRKLRSMITPKNKE